jgi:transcriptional regulator NrdR family protein
MFHNWPRPKNPPLFFCNQDFVESKIVVGVRKAGSTAEEAARVAREVSIEVTHKTEVTAEELSNVVVTSLKKVNKAATNEFVKFRDKKLKAKRKLALS